MTRGYTTEVSSDIYRAADLLWSGQLVAVPTETVYGLAGNALDGQAVACIFAVKNRPSFDPLICHVPDLDSVAGYVTEIPAALRKLAEAYWPGPLTLLLPRQPIIPDLVTAGLPRVGIRVPQHPLMLELLQELDFPLAAPSANPFGYISPTRPQHVVDQLGGRIPFVLDGGICQVGVESTIVSMEAGQVTVNRKGGLAIEAIEELVGPVQVRTHSTSNPAAPGMLKSHYAPRTPIRLLPAGSIRHLELSTDTAYLTWSTILPPEVPQRVLSPQASLQEAAQHLFAYLRELDALGVRQIVAERLPERGLGRAINDRLQRAAAEPQA
ncbi:MAG: threonylcarbamoyl-AMP synthase [Bacteroidetes bacterium]|nr:MAG: threonylcarbamoyl-AMP synthase [Bacteroidota bacterium]